MPRNVDCGGNLFRYEWSLFCCSGFADYFASTRLYRKTRMPQESLKTIATRHQLHLERLKAGEIGKFDDFLRQMDEDIRVMITRENITDYTRTRLEQQLSLVDSVLRRSLDGYRTIWESSLSEIASYEAGFEVRALSGVVDGVSFSLPSESALLTAYSDAPLAAYGGKALSDVYSGFEDDEIARMKGVIRMGYAEGQTNAQILSRIRGTKAAKYKDGELAKLKRNQETLVRTSVQHMAQQARSAVHEANRDVIGQEEWVAVLDTRTSTECRSLSGKLFDIGKGPQPPLHPRCRSNRVARLKKEFAFLEKGAEQVARSPETGKIYRIDAKTTYYDWLKDQPAKYQDSVLGVTRAKLLRDGGLTADRFAELQLDKNFEPLNLDQMRKLDPLAFERAGL